MKAKKCLAIFLTVAFVVGLVTAMGASSIKTIGTGKVSYEAGKLTNYGGERTEHMLIGGRYTIGAYDVTLTSLGYMFCAGNGNVIINVYDVGDSSLVATATTDSSYGVTGQVLYADLATPVILSAGKSYYILMESNGNWKETVGVAANSSLVTPTGRAFFDGTSFVVPEELIYNYGGVTLTYDMSYNPYVADEQELITASEIWTGNGAGIWNEFGSYIGMTIRIGSDDLTVTEVGRMTFTGNAQVHNLRIVDAETKRVLVTVPVDMTQGTSGTYLYAKLPYVVNLLSGKTYYVLSEEHAGGDMSGMGDYYNTEISDALAMVGEDVQLFGCYFIEGVYTEVPQTGAGRSYVGMNLKFGEPAAAPTPTPTEAPATATPDPTESVSSGEDSPSTGDTGGATIFILICGIIMTAIVGSKYTNSILHRTNID